MRIKQFLPASLALVLAACGPSGGDGKGGHGPGAGMPPTQVSVITVAPTALPANFEYTGQTLGSREVEVRARVTGIIQSRNFTEGGKVAKGESLFTIDPAPFIAVALRSEADVAAAEARLAQSKKNAARLKPLFAEKAVSQKEFDDAVSAEAIGEADVKAAKARLLEAQIGAAEAREKQALAGYQGAIQNAFREVRAALTAQTRARESFEAEGARATALAAALRLARLRYDNGLVSQLDVIDAQRNLLAAEIARYEALRAQRAAVADLYKALGG